MSDLEAVLASPGAAHVNAANKAGMYPLGLATLLSGRSALHVAARLLSAGADPNFEPPGASVYGRPLFMLARITDAGEAAALLCKALLEANADPSIRDAVRKRRTRGDRAPRPSRFLWNLALDMISFLSNSLTEGIRGVCPKRATIQTARRRSRLCSCAARVARAYLTCSMCFSKTRAPTCTRLTRRG